MMNSSCHNFNFFLISLMATVTEPIPLAVYFLYFIEVLFLLFSVFCGYVVVLLAKKRPPFHPNLLALLLFNVYNMVPAHVSRLIFILYEVFIGLQDGECHILLLVSSLVLYMYLFGVLHTPILFISERILSVYLIDDYEKKRRSWISRTMLFLLYTSSAAATAYFTVNDLGVFACAIYSSIFVTIACLLYACLLVWHNKTAKQYPDALISVKFQIKENNKVIKLLNSIVASCAIMCSMEIAFAIWMVKSGTTPLNIELTFLVISCSPAVVLITAIVSIERWRRLIWKLYPGQKTMVYVIQEVDRAARMEQHFKQLEAAWSPPYAAEERSPRKPKDRRDPKMKKY